MSATPTGQDPMKEAEELISAMRSAGLSEGHPLGGATARREADQAEAELRAFIRKLVEAQPPAVAGEADDTALLMQILRYWEADHISRFGPKGFEESVASGDYPVFADLRKRLAAPAAPSVGEPTVQLVKHWCETCNGVGTIDERLGGHSFSNPASPCPDCDGDGWWTPASPAAPAGVPTQQPLLWVGRYRPDGKWTMFDAKPLVKHSTMECYPVFASNSFHLASGDWGKAQNGGVCPHMTQEARRA